VDEECHGELANPVLSGKLLLKWWNGKVGRWWW